MQNDIGMCEHYKQFTFDHPFKLVKDNNDEYIPIDEKIAELIDILWSLDISTLNSCQCNPSKLKWIWIQFATIWDADKFLSIVNKNYKASVQSKDVYQRSIQNIWANDNNWKYDVFPNNIGSEPYEYENDQIIGDEPKSPFVNFEISVRFPPQDYSYVLNKIKEYKANTLNGLP